MDVLHEKAVTYARSIVTADHEGSLTFSLTDFFSQVFPAREAEHMQQRDDKSRRSDPKNHAGHCQGFHFPFLGFTSISHESLLEWKQSKHTVHGIVRLGANSASWQMVS